MFHSHEQRNISSIWTHTNERKKQNYSLKLQLTILMPDGNDFEVSESLLNFDVQLEVELELDYLRAARAERRLKTRFS